MVANEPQAGGSGLAGLAAPDEKRANRLFQGLDTLADRRRCHMQIACRKVEGPTAVDGGKGGKLGGVKH